MPIINLKKYGLFYSKVFIPALAAGLSISISIFLNNLISKHYLKPTCDRKEGCVDYKDEKEYLALSFTITFLASIVSYVLLNSIVGVI